MLQRIVLTKDGPKLDPEKKTDGRGAWICKDPACAEKMAKRRGLDRTFRSRFSAETYARIREEMRELYG